LVDGPHTARYNMACDEAIFRSVSGGAALPVLRLYQWEPSAISIGYHGDAGQVDTEHCREMGWEWVRRPTGGGAVFHDRELTYAVIAPAMGLGTDVLSIYRAVSEGLVAGLRRLGLQAELQPPQRQAARPHRVSIEPPGDDPAGVEAGSPWAGVCFDTPSAYELTVAGKKVVGSAQVRRGGYFLQHGSILIEAEPHRHLWGFRIESPAVRAAAEQAFARHAAGLAEVMGRRPGVEELAEAIAAGMGEALDLELVPSGLNAEEQELLLLLAEHKYGTWAWNVEGVDNTGRASARPGIVPGRAAGI